LPNPLSSPSQPEITNSTQYNDLGERPHSWWTGKFPGYGICPGVNQEGIIRSLPLPNLQQCTRQQVLDYFDNTWTLTEVLFSALQSEEAFYRPPYHQLRHPLIFYYCHPVVLYVNKLRVVGLIKQPVNAYFEQLFETGVDEMSWDDLSKNQMQWPAIHEITEYRKKVYELVKNIIAIHPDFDHLPITENSPLWAIFMGFEHERIHLETSSVLMRELPIHLLRKSAQWPEHFHIVPTIVTDPIVEVDYPSNHFIDVNAQSVQIGKPHHFPSYGWDNEYGSNTVQVKKFRATEQLISNGEFREFLLAGGYQEQRFWTVDGWKWRTFRNAKHPTFWVPKSPAELHQYQLRLCFEIVPMQWSWPVEVNLHEAKAYCAWHTEKYKTAIPFRLLTEAEHHCLREETKLDPVMLDSGHVMLEKKTNINLAYSSANPTNAMRRTSSGFYDVFGNVWEWCEDHFSALSGFEVNGLYNDFSTPCFDGKHHIIMGGSFMSTGDEASVFARFHFRPHFFQHAGFRIVHPYEKTKILETTCLDAPPPHMGSTPCCTKVKNSVQKNPYETQDLLNQYLLLHYGTHDETSEFLPEYAMNFPKRCVDQLQTILHKYQVKPFRALDLGCAVGGASFELARIFNEVTGIDISESFIQTANILKTRKKIDYLRKDEGKLFSSLVASVDHAIDTARVTFQVGDACSLPADIGNFDVALLANILCRLPSPSSCLMRMSGPLGLIKKGGLLFITTPYSWLSVYTPPGAWLGGKKINNTSFSSYAGLRQILENNFELVLEENMPLIIREHQRKFEFIIAHATCWRRIK